MAWCSPTSSRPKKSRLQKFRFKTLLIAFFNNKGIIHKDFFLQENPLLPHYTRQFWTYCYSVSGGFGQSCTGLENGCCSTIMPLYTVRFVCAKFWLRRWQLCLFTLLTCLIWLLRIYSCFPAWRRPSKVHVLRTWMPSKIVWQLFCDRFHRRRLLIVSGSCTKVYCSGWRLFGRAIKKICLYLLFGLFSDRIHRSF